MTEELWQLRSKARLMIHKLRLFPDMPNVRVQALGLLAEVKALERKLTKERKENGDEK